MDRLVRYQLSLNFLWWWRPEQAWKGCRQSGDNYTMGQIKRGW